MRGRARRRPILVALIPAHDEEAALPAALGSLQRQTLLPDQVVVDADSLLDPGFLEAACRYLRDDTLRPDARGSHGLGGVGGTFRGGPGAGLLGAFQRNEYVRYARDVRRLKGRALVLTGTASVYPVKVLREVQQARRDGRIPDRSGAGEVYDVHVLTEDNELSLALMHLGYGILTPKECTLETEVMATWRDLARQRLRWKRGAIENIVDYGLTRVTAAYWRRQLMSLLGLVATAGYLFSIAYAVAVGFRVHPFWLAASVVFSVERMVMVRRRGWPQMAMAAVLVVEMIYDVFLQTVQGRAFAQAVLRTQREW